jgi:hypothetical protein
MICLRGERIEVRSAQIIVAIDFALFPGRLTIDNRMLCWRQKDAPDNPDARQASTRTRPLASSRGSVVDGI